MQDKTSLERQEIGTPLQNSEFCPGLSVAVSIVLSVSSLSRVSTQANNCGSDLERLG